MDISQDVQGCFLQEEEIFRLGEGEPMALIDKKTQNRIRSTAEMPQRPDQIRADIERAQVVNHAVSAPSPTSMQHTCVVHIKAWNRAQE